MAQEANCEKRWLSAGSVLKVVFSEPLKGGKLKGGMEFEGKLGDAVTANKENIDLIPKGTKIKVKVIEAHGGRWFGRGGKIVLEPLPLTLTLCDLKGTVKLRFRDPADSAKLIRKGGGLFFPLRLFFFLKGKDAELYRDYPYEMVTLETTTVPVALPKKSK